MASPGWAQLGNALAGGNKLNAELAYEQGESLGAKTQDALAQARQRVDENNAREHADEDLAGVIPDPKVRAAVVNGIRGGYNPENTFKSIGQNDTNNRNNQIADMSTPDAQVARNLLANGRNANLVHAVGQEGNLTNELHPDAGVQMSALGQQLAQGKADEQQATVAERKASAERASTAADVNRQIIANGGKAPAGFRYDGTDEDGNPKLVPIKGGPKDPDGTGAPLGSREASMLGRVIAGGKQSVAALKSILAAPTGANAGIIGIGKTPGHNLMQSTLDTFRNKASDEDTQTYNSMLPGLSRGLAAIETMGLVPGGTFVGSFDNLQFRAGDSEETRLHKLAEVRQVIENGMDVLANNPRLPASQRQYVKQIQDEVRQVIPFTHSDLFAMKAKPGETVQDEVNSHTKTPTAAPAATGAAPPAGGAAPVSLDQYLKSKGF